MEEHADEKTQVLDAIREYGNLTRACEALDLPRSTVHRWRQSDAAFDADVREAMQGTGAEEEAFPEQADTVTQWHEDYQAPVPSDETAAQMAEEQAAADQRAMYASGALPLALEPPPPPEVPVMDAQAAWEAFREALRTDAKFKARVMAMVGETQATRRKGPLTDLIEALSQ